MKKKLAFILCIALCCTLVSNCIFAESLYIKSEFGRLSFANGNNAKTMEIGEDTNNSIELEALLKEILAALEEDKPDAGKLKKLQDRVYKLDKKSLEEFSREEALLKGENESEMLKRHNDFVSKYKENMAQLKEALGTFSSLAYIKGTIFPSVKNEYKEKVKELKNNLKEKWISKEFNSLGAESDSKSDLESPSNKRVLSSSRAVTVGTIKKEYTPSFAPSTAASSTYNTADLAETIDVKLTPEIKKLAKQLENNPVKIYEYVHNNIDYSLNYGSVKGSLQTLLQKSGNDFDQASLLISLYRAAGIPARYVMGKVRMPIEDAENWIGIKDAKSAVDSFASGGIPCVALMVDSKIKFMEKDHVWVEAYVPINSYRGARSKSSGKGWVQMDPSFKKYVQTPGLDIASKVSFDQDGLMKQIQSKAIVGDNGASVANTDTDIITKKLEAYRTEAQKYIDETYPEADAEDISGARKIVTERFSILPSSLPYKILSVQKELASLTDNFRQKLTLEIGDSGLGSYDFGDIGMNNVSISYSASIPELAGKRISLGYIAATKQDEELIKSLMPKAHQDGSEIKPEEIPSSLPANLINVKPQLSIDGNVVATGNAVQLGTEQQFTMDFTHPTISNDPMRHIENKIDAGAQYFLTLDTGCISKEEINKVHVQMKESQKDLEGKKYDTIKTEQVIGSYLNTIGLSYFYQVDYLDKILAHSMDIRVDRLVSEAITAMDINVYYTFGMPRKVTQGGLSIDVDRLSSTFHSANGESSKEMDFFHTSGIIGSYLEGSIFQQIFKGKAVSTIHILLEANSKGIPIYNIDSSNADTIFPKLQYDQATLQTLRGLVNSGKKITIPGKGVEIGNWKGTGYISEDTTKMVAAYMIDGGLSGGWTDIPQNIRIYGVAMISMLLLGVVGVACGVVGGAALLAFGVLMLIFLPIIALVPDDVLEIMFDASAFLVFVNPIAAVLGLSTIVVHIIDAILKRL